MLITLAAAFGQNLRSILQKKLTTSLGPDSSSYLRFVYALPFAGLYLMLLAQSEPVPSMNERFLLYAATGALGQIVGTLALVRAFELRSFGVATAYSKTEVLQTALAGALVLGDAFTLPMLIGILISFAGVLLLSERGGLRALLVLDKGAVLGLISGLGFAFAAIGYRGGSLALDSGSVVMRAALTLFMALAVQTLVMGVYIAWRGELRAVMKRYRAGLLVGLIGMAASVGWFTAMAMENAARVRAVGQVELVFAVVTSLWLFRERVSRRELVGVVLIITGVVVLLELF